MRRRGIGNRYGIDMRERQPDFINRRAIIGMIRWSFIACVDTL